MPKFSITKLNVSIWLLSLSSVTSLLKWPLFEAHVYSLYSVMRAKLPAVTLAQLRNVIMQLQTSVLETSRLRAAATWQQQSQLPGKEAINSFAITPRLALAHSI